MTLRRSVTAAWDAGAVAPIGLLLLLPVLAVDDASSAMAAGMSAGGAGLIGLATQAALAAVLTGWFVVVVRPLRRALLRRAATVAGYTLAGSARSLTFVVLVGAGNLEHPAALITVRTASTVLALTIVAVVVHGIRRGAEQLQRLAAQHARLRMTRLRTTAELDRTRAELASTRARMHDLIITVVGRLRPGMDRGSLAGVADLIEQVVEHDVRPTSHELARMPDLGDSSAATEAIPTKRSAFAASTLRAWPDTRPYQPAVVLLIGAPLIAGALWATSGIIASWLQFTGLLAQVLLLWAFARLWPAADRLPPAVRHVALVGSYALVAGVGLLAARLTAQSGTDPLVEATLLPIALALLAAGTSAAEAVRESARRRGQRLIARSEFELCRAHQQLWAERRRLAVVLHGCVQGALVATLVLLRRQLRQPDPVVPADLIHRLRATLTEAAALEIAAPPTDSLTDRITRQSRVWGGILTVTVTVSEEADAALNADRDCTDAVTEVLREVLLNAVRHGRASAASVSVCSGKGTTVVLTVREMCEDRPTIAAGPSARGGSLRPKAPGSDAGDRGLGSTLLTSLALRWSAEQAGNCRTTTAVLVATPAVPRQRMPAHAGRPAAAVVADRGYGGHPSMRVQPSQHV